MKTYLISCKNESEFAPTEVFSDPDLKKGLTQVHHTENNTTNYESLAAFEQIKQQLNFDASDHKVKRLLDHKQIWKELLNGPFAYCLIVENTLQFKASTPELESIIAQLPEGWDVFFPFAKRGFGNPTAIGEFKYCSFTNATVLMDLYWNGSIYFISKAGAAKMLSSSSIADTQNTSPIASVYFRETSWFTPALRSATKRNEEQRNAIFNYNTWNVSDKQLARLLLKLISKAVADNDIDIILHGGSFLGYIRHGEIMPWDDDIDLGIEESRLNEFQEVISCLPGVFIERSFEKESGTYYYKIWHADGAPIENYHYTFPFIDLWLYKSDGNNILFHNGFIFPNSLQKPLQTVSFEGASFKIPHNPLECLDSMYKNWRTAIMVYPWRHKLEIAANYHFHLDITVDSAGRII
jgi:hypothetical protein